MARKRFHGLKRAVPKIRATWNKHNLYNLSRLKPPNTAYPTHYQQKWTAKSMTRAYHGEQIREGQWERMFTPLLNAVIPMDHRYLADNDGSELAAGRGSGKEKPFKATDVKFGRNQIPYNNMTYAPIERRLDTAIFRALFASSVRQARQFVVHGQVKVNGKKMPYSGYLLNPGDMFQVDPDRVLFATGAKKLKDQSKSEKARYERRVRRHTNITRNAAEAKRAERARAKAEKELLDDNAPITQVARSGPVALGDSAVRKLRQRELQKLVRQIEDRIGSKKIRAGGKRKQALRVTLRRAKAAMIFLNRKSIEELDKEIKEVTQEFLGMTEEGESGEVEDKKPSRHVTPISELKPSAKKALEAKIAEIRESIKDNPVDDTKPYATPWTPRPYMSPFAFIPRYLEVNQNICSAVYLRHPVARPGLAEVPSPFPAETQQLAFTWYLRRK